MSVRPEYSAYILEMLEPLEGASIRRMFGGAGVFCHGVMIALLTNDKLYFKVDGGNRGTYESAGSRPFTYQGKSKPVEMSYWKIPVKVLASDSELISWAEGAYEAAKRAKKKKKKR